MLKVALPLAWLTYMALGVFHFMLIQDGLENWLSLPGLFAGILALFLGYMPLIGSVVSLFAAVDVWGWTYWEAGMLFAVPFLLMTIVGLAEYFDDKRVHGEPN